MDSTNNRITGTTHLRTFFWGLCGTWTLIVTGLLFMGIIQTRQTAHETARNEARANFNKDQALRFWATKHVGIYVPATEQTPPNPYLSHSVSFGALWILGITGIGLSLRNLRRRVRERDAAELKLKKAYDELELRVAERTADLVEVNKNLHVEIYERKMADKALRESERRHWLLFENVGEAIYVAQDGKIIFINPKTEELYGYSEEELASKPFMAFLHKEDRKRESSSPMQTM